MAQGQIQNFASVFLNVNPSTVNGVTVNLEWFLDASLTVFLESQTWVVPIQSKLTCVVPAMGNYCTLSITTASAAGGTCAVSLYPSNIPADGIHYLGTVHSIAEVAVPVPISGAIFATFPSVAAGDYTLFGTDTGSSGHLTFTVTLANENSSAGPTVLLQFAPVTHFTQEFSSGDDPLLVTVSNSDAAATHNASFTLLCKVK